MAVGWEAGTVVLMRSVLLAGEQRETRRNGNARRRDARAGNPVQYALWRPETGNSEGRMGGIKLITALYTFFFVLMILIAIGSFFGVFDNPLIDPGL
jgi:hypothetical protein